MAGTDELRQAFIDAKLSGTKTPFGYEFNFNETAAAKALDVVTKWLAERDVSANAPSDRAQSLTPLSDGFSPTSPRGNWPEATREP